MIYLLDRFNLFHLISINYICVVTSENEIPEQHIARFLPHRRLDITVFDATPCFAD
jgi:hypothetical protein